MPTEWTWISHSDWKHWGQEDWTVLTILLRTGQPRPVHRLDLPLQGRVGWTQDPSATIIMNHTWLPRIKEQYLLQNQLFLPKVRSMEFKWERIAWTPDSNINLWSWGCKGFSFVTLSMTLSVQSTHFNAKMQAPPWDAGCTQSKVPPRRVALFYSRFHWCQQLKQWLSPPGPFPQDSPLWQVRAVSTHDVTLYSSEDSITWLNRDGITGSEDALMCSEGLGSA